MNRQSNQGRNMDYGYEQSSPQMYIPQNMTNANRQINRQQEQPLQQPQEISSNNNNNKIYKQCRYSDKPYPYLTITEQPSSFRLRYESEEIFGSILGVNSTPKIRTFPSIKIEGYTGRVDVVVSCVTKDPPYMAHPHKLFKKIIDHQNGGVIKAEINPEINMEFTFEDLGIICVKRKEIIESLNSRELTQVDPFSAGFSHKAAASYINLNALRLCFHAFIFHYDKNGKHKYTPLKPVVSDVIYNMKSMFELVICNAVPLSASAKGGDPMIILCDKIFKNDIEVRFFEEIDGRIIWEHIEQPTANRIHKQCAIYLTTPRYYDQNIIQPVRLGYQLYRPSDQTYSEAIEFLVLPNDRGDFNSLKRKRVERQSDFGPKTGAYNLGSENTDLSSLDEISNKILKTDRTNEIRIDKKKKCLNELITKAAYAIPQDSAQPINNTILIQCSVQTNTIPNTTTSASCPPNVTMQTRENAYSPDYHQQNIMKPGNFMQPNYSNQMNYMNPNMYQENYMANNQGEFKENMNPNMYQPNQMGNNQEHVNYPMEPQGYPPQGHQSFMNRKPSMNQQPTINQQYLMNQPAPINHQSLMNSNYVPQNLNTRSTRVYGEPKLEDFAEQEEEQSSDEEYRSSLETVEDLSGNLQSAYLEDIDLANIITEIFPSQDL